MGASTLTNMKNGRFVSASRTSSLQTSVQIITKRSFHRGVTYSRRSSAVSKAVTSFFVKVGRSITFWLVAMDAAVDPEAERVSSLSPLSVSLVSLGGVSSWR